MVEGDEEGASIGTEPLWGIPLLWRDWKTWSEGGNENGIDDKDGVADSFDKLIGFRESSFCSFEESENEDENVAGWWRNADFGVNNDDNGDDVDDGVAEDDTNEK